MDGDLIEQLIWIIVLVLAPLLQRLFRKKQDESPWEDVDLEDSAPEPYPEPSPPPAYPQEPPPAYPQAPAPYPVASPEPAPPSAATVVQQRLEIMAKHAETVAAAARVQRITSRFVPTLLDFVARPARQWLQQLQRTGGPPPPELYADLEQMDMVLGQVESFIGQRRNEALAPKLGDADEFALSCYEPVARFAHAEGLGLTSHVPVTEFGPFDMSIWTGFFPTGLAPLYLPSDFFERISWWPALAHEIGHDFLNATAGMEDDLRDELGLPSQEVGSRPLAFDQQGLSMHELVRVYGGWFEELFCDVFATLMCGPAYVWTMIEHFATPYDPSQVVRVRVDRTGRRYDEHPPRHLRFITAVKVVELVGQEDDADRLREQWHRLHGEPDGIYFPIAGQLIGIPLAPLVSVAEDLAGRLYGDQMTAFNGYSLPSVPGVDFGPHANAEALRVRDELLSGRVPHHTGARSVVAGAVLAWHQAPEREPELIRLARAAIAAEGTFEDDVDAYDAAERPAAKRPVAVAGTESAREAFLLHTILSPAPSMRRFGLGVRTGGFLSRRGW